MQLLSRQMTVALGEQQLGKRHALARRPQARVAHPLVDRHFAFSVAHHRSVCLCELRPLRRIAALPPNPPCKPAIPCIQTYILSRRTINSGTLTAWTGAAAISANSRFRGETDCDTTPTNEGARPAPAETGKRTNAGTEIQLRLRGFAGLRPRRAVRPRKRAAALSADADVRPHHRDQRDRRRLRQGLHPRRTRHPPRPLVLRLPFHRRSGHAGLPRPRRAVADDRLLPRLARRARQGHARCRPARSSSRAW